MPHFTASERLMREGIAGASEIEAVDRKLSTLSTTSALDPRWIARDLLLPERTVRQILDGFGQHHVVGSMEMMECPRCEAKTPLQTLEEAHWEEDPYPCPGSCEQDLDPRTAERVVLYELLDTPAE